MNPWSGDMEAFAEVPKGWLELTDEEAREYLPLSLDDRLARYMDTHPARLCKTCGCTTGNHSLRKFKECAASELARFDTERLERQLKEKMPDVSELFAQLPTRTLEEATDFNSLREAHKRRRAELEALLME